MADNPTVEGSATIEGGADAPVSPEVQRDGAPGEVPVVPSAPYTPGGNTDATRAPENVRVDAMRSRAAEQADPAEGDKAPAGDDGKAA